MTKAPCVNADQSSTQEAQNQPQGPVGTVYHRPAGMARQYRLTGREGKKMRTIEITYEIKTANGNWIRRVYATNDGNDYERVVNILHQNKDEYRVIKVRHI